MLAVCGVIAFYALSGFSVLLWLVVVVASIISLHSVLFEPPIEQVFVTSP